LKLNKRLINFFSFFLGGTWRRRPSDPPAFIVANHWWHPYGLQICLIFCAGIFHRQRAPVSIATLSWHINCPFTIKQATVCQQGLQGVMTRCRGKYSAVEMG